MLGNAESRGLAYRDGCVMDDGSGAVSHAETCYIVTHHTAPCHVSRVRVESGDKHQGLIRDISILRARS